MESTIAVVVKQNEHLRPKAVFETRPDSGCSRSSTPRLSPCPVGLRTLIQCSGSGSLGYNFAWDAPVILLTLRLSGNVMSATRKEQGLEAVGPRILTTSLSWKKPQLWGTSRGLFPRDEEIAHMAFVARGILPHLAWYPGF